MTQQRTLMYSSRMIIVANTYCLTMGMLTMRGGRVETKLRDHLGDLGTNNIIL